MGGQVREYARGAVAAGRRIGVLATVVVCAAAGLSGVVGVPPAQASTAQTLFSNMPGAPTVAGGINAESVTNTSFLAFRFVASASGTADWISVYSQCTSNGASCLGSGAGTLQLYTDGGGHPGSTISSQAPFQSHAVSGAPDCASLGTGPALAQGTTYWAVMRGNDGNGTNWLFENDTLSSDVYFGNGTTWSPIPNAKTLSLRVQQGGFCAGHLVPNPADGTPVANMFPPSGGKSTNTIEISNDGISALNLESNHITGPDAGVFQVLDANPADSPLPPNPFPQTYQLQPGGLVLLYVTCNGPVQDGHFVATLTVTSDTGGNSGTPVSWPLSCYVDNTPPTLSFSVTPNGSNGWFTTPSATIGLTGDDGPNGSGTSQMVCTDNGSPALDSPSGGTQFSVTGEGTHHISCTAHDVAGNVTPTATTTDVKIDSVAPNASTSVVPAPNAAGWNNTSATVHFDCTDNGSGIANGTTPGDIGVAAETNGQTVSPSGPCTDNAGNTTAPPSALVKIDMTAPDTSIVGPPDPRVSSNNAAFTLSGTDAGSGIDHFVCTLDGNPVACTADVSLTALSAGSHSFTAAAVDAAGNVDASPATADWFVDNSAPTVAFDSPADGGTVAVSDVGIAFHATDVDDTDGFTFLCSVDGAPATSCTSPYQTGVLTDGLHHVTVTPSDGVGNEGAPQTLTFTVDTTPPTVTIDSPQPDDVTGHHGTASFHASDPGNDGAVLTFTCSIDGAPATACSSPFAYTNLANGQHTITVVAIDPVGNQSAPVTVTFTVDANAPLITSPAQTSVAAKTPLTFTITTANIPQALIHARHLPAWLTLTDNGDGTATLTGTPPKAGTTTLQLVAANAHGPRATQTLTITAFRAPKFLSGARSVAGLGLSFSLDVATTGSPYPTVSSADLPPWLTLTPVGFGHATIAGTPPTVGTFTFTLTATNIGGSVDQLFTLKVKNGITGIHLPLLRF